MIHNCVVTAIGNTPLIRLRRVSEETGCNIYGKAEFMNPGQSVKDRAALAIIRDAETRKLIEPGGLIVEGTAGNTGIGLAMVANALGYRCTIVIPRTQTEEKKQAIRMFGAELIEVDAVPYTNPQNYVHVAGRLAEERANSEPRGAIWARQFDNQANREGHRRTTAEEIWQQTDGKVDAFICAVGTGGTLGGVSLALKEKRKDIVIGLADPMGAKLFHWYRNGELKAEGDSVTEGIGQGRVTDNLTDVEVDIPYMIPDAEALQCMFDMVTDEGLCLGGSAGMNVAGAVRLARELGPGHTIVTILCDPGSRYTSKLFNPDFLKSRGLPCPAWLG